MRHRKLRWQRAKRKLRRLKMEIQEELDHAVWYEQNAKRNEAIYNLPEGKLDEFLIHEWFSSWKNTIETGYIDGKQACDYQRLEAVAYLGFRPDKPQVVKTRRWLKRLARKPSELSEVFWFLTTEHFGEEDNYFAMCGYHVMLKGLKRFIKANKLYKVDVIKQCFNGMAKSIGFCWVPKKDKRAYKKCMRIWHALADAKED